MQISVLTSLAKKKHLRARQRLAPLIRCQLKLVYAGFPIRSMHTKLVSWRQRIEDRHKVKRDHASPQKFLRLANVQ